MTTTPTLRDAAQAVLDALDECRFDISANEALRAALAAPADALAEPVAWRERMRSTNFWSPCTKARHDDVLNRPHLWPGVEVQALVPAMTAVATPSDALARAMEDAACVCDQLGRDWWEARKVCQNENPRKHLHSKVHGAEQCAAAIRAKGQQ